MLRIHGRRAAKRSRRATVMLEFALVAPFFLIFIALIADVGFALLVKNSAQDAAFAAARAGAQVGGSQLAGGSTEAVAASAAAFDSSIGVHSGWLDTHSMTVLNACDDPSNPMFVTQVDFTVNMSLLDMVGLGGPLASSVEGVSRCEIVRG